MHKLELELSDHYQLLKQCRNDGFIFQYSDDEKYNGRTVSIEGKEHLFFASCGYLGLETYPALIDAAVEAVKKYGTQ